MFTAIDKALVAVIMGLVFLAKELWGVDIGLTEGTADGIANFMIFVLTAVGVYKTPNKA